MKTHFHLISLSQLFTLHGIMLAVVTMNPTLKGIVKCHPLSDRIQYRLTITAKQETWQKTTKYTHPVDMQYQKHSDKVTTVHCL